MLGMMGNADATFKAWNDEQRRTEIGYVVQGYRNGLPADFLCQLSIRIAGGESEAREHLAALVGIEERQEIVARAADPKLRDQLSAILL